MLRHRLIIAGVGVPLLIFLCMLNNPVYIVVLFTLFGMIGLWEFYVLLRKNKIFIYVYILGAFTLFLGLLPVFTGLRADLPLFLTASSIGVFIILCAGLFLYPPTDQKTGKPSMKGMLDTVFSVYVFIFFCVLYTLMIQLRAWDDHGGRYLLLVFFSVMAGDSGAYFAGRYLGRHLLMPKISPKKTWEGVLGNFCGNIIGITLYYIFIYRGFSYTHLLMISLLLGFIAIFSDLFVSYIKRSTGVKDSGVVFPGHGGVLDRTDSLLFTNLAVLIIVHYMQYSGIL